MAVMVVFSVHVCKLEDQYETHFREGEIWKISILQMARAFTSYFWQRREKERERVKFGGPISCIFLGNQIFFSVLKILCTWNLNFDFKFQVFPSHQDRKSNSSIRFLGEVMARQFCFEIYWPLVFAITKNSSQ